jgi:hypothetical protein
MGSEFDDFVYCHFFAITANYNSSHIELLLNHELQLLSHECSQEYLTNLELISITLKLTNALLL